MSKKIVTSLVLSLGFLLSAYGQDTDTLAIPEVSIDSVKIEQKKDISTADTLEWVADELPLDKKTKKVLEPKIEFKPNPTRAVIYSAIFPGLGQIYNRKYWKLPIIYGGFIGLSYAISWNGRYYNDYTNAYRAIMRENPRSPENAQVWLPFISGATDPDQITDSQIATYKNSFKRNRDSYRRYRDLSIIGVVALYALCVIDAYVDASLFDFDISPDLSLKVEPAAMRNEMLGGNSFGVQCSVKF